MKKTNLFIVTVLFPFVSDILIGASTYFQLGASSIGQIYRGIFFPLGILFSLKSLAKGKYFLELYLISYAFISAALLSDFSYESVYVNVTDAVKHAYVFCLFFLFKLLHGERSVSKELIYIARNIGLLYSLSIIVCFYFEIGFPTYLDGVFGWKGLISAQNDVSVLLASCYILLFGSTEKTKFHIAVLIVIFASMVILNTRTSILIAFAVPVIYGVVQARNLKNIFILVLSLATIIVIFDAVFSNLLYDEYHSQKYLSLISGRLDRFFLLNAAFDYLVNSSAWAIVFGSGNHNFLSGTAANLFLMTAGNELKGVEMDFFDTMGPYGILYAVLKYYFFARVLIKSLVVKHFSYALALTCLIVHSFFAGHVFNNTMISFLLAFLFIDVDCQYRKRMSSIRNQRYSKSSNSIATPVNCTHNSF